MAIYQDQTGHTITCLHVPQRIVSLVPSQTELLFSLGLDQEVAGITKFCIHPEAWFRGKTRVGGTKKLNINTIRQLQPDLIIANKEENTKEEILLLQQEFPVWTSDISNLDEACTMIREIGAITGRDQNATAIVNAIRSGFQQLNTSDLIDACYLIWKDPYMTVGSGTFINNMLPYAGFSNLFGDKERYPEISLEQLQEMQPSFLLLSSEPYPFNKQHAAELQLLLPRTKIMLVDGEMFSWYGSRLLKAIPYFKQLRNDALSLIHAAGI